MECTPDQIDLWARFDQNLDHIESIRYARVIQQPEPFFRAAHDSILLRSCHPGVGRPERVGCAGLYFNENQGFCASIAADQIDFAASSGSEIFVKDTKPVATKVIGSDFLTGTAERQVARAKLSANHFRPESTEK